MKDLFEVLGGKGSGNFGHAGRPGKAGGSGTGKRGKASTQEEAAKIFDAIDKKNGLKPTRGQTALAVVRHKSTGYERHYLDSMEKLQKAFGTGKKYVNENFFMKPM